MRFIVGVRNGDDFLWLKSSVEDLTPNMEEATKYDTIQAAQSAILGGPHNPDSARNVVYLALNG